MANIRTIKARKILDSRSNATLEVDVILDDGSFGRASVPAGASTGRYEAFKLMDIDKAIANVAVVAPYLENKDVSQQRKIDQIMIDLDGTEFKDNIGGNVMLAISLASCEASANSFKMPLYKYLAELFGTSSQNLKIPTPLFNIINGGKHSDNNLPFQEFMIIPTINGTDPKKMFSEKLFLGSKVYHQLKSDLQRLDLSVAVGDEGGFAPQINTNEEAIELLVSAISHCGIKAREEMSIGIDSAASSISNLEMITYPTEPVEYYKKLTDRYPIMLLEDPLKEDDWKNWTKLTGLVGEKVKIVGDDLYTTHKDRVLRGIHEKSSNSVLIKPDQVGTLSETLETIATAKKAGLTLIISHRSGETESTFIADLSVAVGANYLKAGAPSRGERISKYNRLLRIEEEL